MKFKGRYVDAHCHIHEFTENRIREFRDFIIIGVSDDEPSSRKTLELSRKFDNIIPNVGVHPWHVHEVSVEELNNVLKLANQAKGIGEVGLDTKFKPETIERQREFFLKFLQVAKEYDLPMNVHAAGTWGEVLELLRKFDIKKALIHWFTGNLELIDEIVSLGYFISINPAIKIQKKQRQIVEYAPIEIILTESDGPYSYRGLELEPTLIPELISEIAKIKNMKVNDVIEVVRNNLRRFVLL